MSYYIDSHCHIFAEQFAEDVDVAIQEATDAGVKKILMPNIDRASVDAMNALAMKYPEVCYSMMAIHPCDVKENIDEDLKYVEEELASGKYIAVGETGIDLYWDKTFIAQQKESFKAHLRFGKQFGLPVVIHIRESFDEVFEVVEKEVGEGLFGIFHCFTGTHEQAMRAIELGFSLGIGGVVTFKNSGVDNNIKAIGLEHMVLETDSPYLAPVPHRGKRNEPSYIPLVAEKLAEVKGVSVEEIARITTENALRIFNLQAGCKS